MTDQEKIAEAIRIGFENGSYDGAHHKMWTIDQMLRVLAGDKYEQNVKEFCDGEDGPDTYGWETGIAP